jgi:glyoxylase-like metal-dependent hydrolase (beta-lactamase superfamily II)
MKIHDEMPIYRITLPTPFPVGPVNLYLITEPELTLIDCGPRTAKAREVLDLELAAIGVAPEQLKKIILTHSHQDHYGLAEELHRRSGAPIYASPVEFPMLCHDPEVRTFYERIMTEAGTPPELLARMDQLFVYLEGVSEAIEECHSIDELPFLQAGPARFSFISTPGHTPGSISFWEPERRVLLAGDAVIERITPNPFSAPDPDAPHGRFRSLAAYWQTFQEIERLHTAVIHAGHGQPVTDFPAYHRWSIELHVSRQQVILKAIKSGAHTPHQIATSLFPEVMKEGSFLALTEIFSHLDLLEEEGRVRSGMRNGVAIYSLHDP